LKDPYEFAYEVRARKCLSLQTLLGSEIFWNWLKVFRKDVCSIDKEAKIYLCGGILKRGFSAGDIDILITSEKKKYDEFRKVKDKWSLKSLLGNCHVIFDHYSDKDISEYPLDLWFYAVDYPLSYFSKSEMSMKDKLKEDLKEERVRLRIA